MPIFGATVSGLGRRFARTDQIAWLPLVLLAMAFCARTPLTPGAARAALRAPPGETRRGSARRWAGLLLHPQTSILGLLATTLVLRAIQAARA